MYDTTAFWPSAERMRKDVNEELAEYLRERMHRMTNRSDSTASWKLSRGRREDLEFWRGDLNHCFEEDEGVLLCPVSSKVRSGRSRYSAYAIIKDFFSSKTGELIATCIVGESGSYYTVCEVDAVAHRSGLSRDLRVVNKIADILSHCYGKIENVED